MCIRDRAGGQPQAASGGVQQQSSVFVPGLVIPAVQLPFVTAQFQILGHFVAGQPDQGIEPTQSQGEKKEGLGFDVLIADMAHLMAEDQLQFFQGVFPLGQNQPQSAVKQPQGEGCCEHGRTEQKDLPAAAAAGLEMCIRDSR